MKQSIKQSATPGMKVYPKHMGRFVLVEPFGLSKEQRVLGKVVDIYREHGINFIDVECTWTKDRQIVPFAQAEVVALENEIITSGGKLGMYLNPKNNDIEYDVHHFGREVHA